LDVLDIPTENLDTFAANSVSCPDKLCWLYVKVRLEWYLAIWYYSSATISIRGVYFCIHMG
ncbi:6067_t:CDS:2, partial [Cetraspora pellucida]